MTILGIETSCDETAAAVVRDGRTLLSNVVASQAEVHSLLGGVVPEVAARGQIEQIIPVVNQALSSASLTWGDIDAIAVTYGPGLVGSLLIGVLAAKTLAEIQHKPLLAVNHVEAHTYAAFLSKHQPQFPLLALTVSGGHTQLALSEGHGAYRVISKTKDDAAGEAFDKVAKVLGLPYPGGPAVSAAAQSGNPDRYPLPSPWLKDSSFSFSGLKTAVLRQAQVLAGGDYTMPSTDVASKLSPEQVADLAASFEQAAVQGLSKGVQLMHQQLQPKNTVVAGGVGANRRLRQALEKLPGVIFAPLELCTDNAAMVACLGHYLAVAGLTTRPSQLMVAPSLSM